MSIFAEKRVYIVSFSCVAGHLLILTAGELLIQPLKHGVVFLNEKDVILTNYVWRIAVDFDMGPSV
jgi:hypothetical protein